jgi:hypothetical protein
LSVLRPAPGWLVLATATVVEADHVLTTDGGWPDTGTVVDVIVLR